MTDLRQFMTDEERNLQNSWSRFGSDCINKVGRLWDSMVPGAPLYKTKREANDMLTRFVCDAIPQRCTNRRLT